MNTKIEASRIRSKTPIDYHNVEDPDNILDELEAKYDLDAEHRIKSMITELRDLRSWLVVKGEIRSAKQVESARCYLVAARDSIGRSESPQPTKNS